MNVLLTNDDGIEAPGLDALFNAVATVLEPTDQISVVAPDRGRSECSHSVTTGRPLQIHQIRPNWFAVDGTPVDCVRAALSTLRPETTAVLSGINAGANLGTDLLVSGTFAAARESAIQGIPAMAVSHYRRPDVPKTWEHASSWLAGTLAEFFDQVRDGSRTPETMLWNINLPAIPPSGPTPERIECPVDRQPMFRTGQISGDRRSAEDRIETATLVMQSDFHRRPRAAGSDVDLCFSGQMTISRLTPRIV